MAVFLKQSCKPKPSIKDVGKFSPIFDPYCLQFSLKMTDVLVGPHVDLTDFCLLLQTIVLRECITHTYGVDFGSELSYTCSETLDPRLVPYR